MLTSDFSSEGLFTQPGLRLDLQYTHIDQRILQSGTRRLDRAADPAAARARDRAAYGQQLRDRQLRLQPLGRLGRDGAGALRRARAHDNRARRYRHLDLAHNAIWGTCVSSGASRASRPNRSSAFSWASSCRRAAGTTISSAGPQTGNPLDRGLQAGTGTTDLIAGVYHFGRLTGEVRLFPALHARRAVRSPEQLQARHRRR